ncbi:hypothetical protein Avbf_04646 [Armadillidium vulgare]|nr:hypothetical protein Avbf_04646 [Armadillidium vulgare]
MCFCSCMLLLCASLPSSCIIVGVLLNLLIVFFNKKTAEVETVASVVRLEAPEVKSLAEALKPRSQNNLSRSSSIGVLNQKKIRYDLLMLSLFTFKSLPLLQALEEQGGRISTDRSPMRPTIASINKMTPRALKRKSSLSQAASTGEEYSPSASPLSHPTFFSNCASPDLLRNGHGNFHGSSDWRPGIDRDGRNTSSTDVALLSNSRMMVVLRIINYIRLYNQIFYFHHYCEYV